MIGYCLKIAYIVVIIGTVTYFLGIFWYIISLELYRAEEEFRATTNDKVYNHETFIDDNSLQPENENKTNIFRLITLMYFAYTTLSTVGFGDITPRSDYERLIQCVIFIMGVAIFGIILSNFTDIIDQFNAFNDEIDEGD